MHLKLSAGFASTAGCRVHWYLEMKLWRRILEQLGIQPVLVFMAPFLLGWVREEGAGSFIFWKVSMVLEIVQSKNRLFGACLVTLYEKKLSQSLGKD